MERKALVMWEKWVDPFGQDMDEAKWTDYNNDITDIDNILNGDPDPDPGSDNNDDEEEEDDEEKKQFYKPVSRNPIKVIASPLGLIPYNEHTASGKIFNFWLGHTNFNISNNVKDIIEQCDGVEILDIFTRYRFRIAIGKCFNDADVINLINENINQIYV
jgi:hypothetical protein